MGLRMTVLAAVATGVLAAPCGGIAPRLGLPTDVPGVLDTAGRAVTNFVVDSSECPKLEVEPTVDEEYSLGSALAIHWAERGGGLLLKAGDAKTRELHVYLNTVGKNLGAQSARPTLQWTFGVLRDPESFNAVSAPGGYVFVTRKLLEGVDNEAQLAGVLAHEIAHVVHRHAITHYNSAKVSECRAAAAGRALSAEVVGPALRSALDVHGGNLLLEKNAELLGAMTEKTLELVLEKGNSKKQEHEADALAVRLMLSAGYDPGEYRKLIAKTDEGGGFSNHPSRKERLANIEAVIQEARKGGDGFQELPTEGLRAPPLKLELTAVIRPNVAKDTP
ncbi:MAG TPA: M48 family metalloprotease [Myxococcus sp.]|nr:M48 family metalloprotease [Myxococcus sp.]